MEDQIVALFKSFFENISGLSPGRFTFDTTNVPSGSGLISDFLSQYLALLNSQIAGKVSVLKPIGYALLALFAMIEFAQLSERVGNVTGFMGAGLVIEVLVKLCLCKLVVDNSFEICQFLVNLGDDIAQSLGTTARIDTIDYAAIEQGIHNIYPAWWDLLGQLGFFIVSNIFIFLCNIVVMIVRVIYTTRFIEITVLVCISPIPLSTTLSKHFNLAPNFLKNLFAVCLQGALLYLVVLIFNDMFVLAFSSVASFGSGEWTKLWGVLLNMLLMSVIFLVSSLQTQRWAKSICHAM